MFSSPDAKMHFGLNPVDGVFVVQNRFLLKIFLENQKKTIIDEALSKVEDRLNALVV